MAALPRRRSAPARKRRLSVGEAQFYARVYGSARKGSLAELRRRGCTEQEAEELFAAAYARVMETVDPIAREFSGAQMVSFVKRACWRCLIDERRRGGRRGELGAGASGAPPGGGAESPAELAEEREAVAIGREALAMLPERERAIFCQRHQLCLTPEEILRRTPGLSMRSYRKLIQRANARVLEAFERIEAGERCAEIEGSALRRHAAGESTPAERRAVEAHLAHCGACRAARARMRGYLVDVAGGAVLASSLGGASAAAATEVPMRLFELASQGAGALGEASRAVRERMREALFKIPGALPGSAAEGGAAQALGATSVRIASACTAGIAAGACVAAGVVPGIGGVGASGHHQARPSPAARPTKAVSAPRSVGASEGGPRTQPGASAGRSVAAEGSGPSSAPSAASSPESSPSSARVSGRQTGTEFGAEAAQPAAPSTTGSSSASNPQSSSGSSGSGAGAPGGSGSRGGGGSAAEFGM